MIKLKPLMNEVSQIGFRKTNTKTSVEISFEEALQLIRNSKESLKLFQSGKFLYRGFDAGRALRYYVEPRNRERVSSYNFYTALTAVLPSWKEFPPRSYSVMFTDASSTAATYGQPYWIFPADDAKIAYCEDTDCWYGFKMINDRIHTTTSVNIVLESFLELIGIVLSSGTENKSYRYFVARTHDIETTKKFLKELDRTGTKIIPRIKKYCDDDDDSERYTIRMMLAKDILKNFKTTWTGYLDDLMNPEDNKIHLTDLDGINRFHGMVGFEMWTDAPCVMIYAKEDVQNMKEGKPSICGELFPEIVKRKELNADRMY